MVNELEELIKLVGQTGKGPELVALECKRISAAWLRVAFSGADEKALDRYFTFHLKGIGQLLDTLYQSNNDHSCPAGSAEISYFVYLIHEILNHLQIQNLQVEIPAYYKQVKLANLRDLYATLHFNLESSGISEGLKGCVLTYIAEMTGQDVASHRISFAALHYFEHFLNAFSGLNWKSGKLDDEVKSLLLHLNFNHLHFLTYLHQHISKAEKEVQFKLEWLYSQRCALAAVPDHLQLIYQRQWPGIKVMFSELLNEEIAAVNNLVKHPVQTVKMSLNLPVSQLAYLIRLFYDNAHFKTTNRTEIFKFFCDHYQTLRQKIISERSLSKEFYSVDQITAANVRGILQSMVLQINKDYFPVWFAAGVMLCAG